MSTSEVNDRTFPCELPAWIEEELSNAAADSCDKPEIAAAVTAAEEACARAESWPEAAAITNGLEAAEALITAIRADVLANMDSDLATRILSEVLDQSTAIGDVVAHIQLMASMGKRR